MSKEGESGSIYVKREFITIREINDTAYDLPVDCEITKDAAILRDWSSFVKK